ncbi:YqjF family protein [Lihuaxuella thermophila]|uniref:DUF2071 domain-containing protein n=1 Tax=Lihuaxuella thermophila TaxID=1173111 RepID=A0A1H8H909_9BACL|nr:DUF2071 domain-containing protein [Lihuaxuella thermophila]SEN52534.1 hypothetical protein SAMN05444955_11389 [Lihuaxuella thermophila]
MRQSNHNPPIGWVMTQTWTDLLLAHWPVPPELIRDQVPSMLEIDTYEQSAWVTIVPFAVNEARLRWLPPLPFMSGLLQLNLRTYVVYNRQPGVYFFSLDASNRLAAGVARTFLHLPFYAARIRMQKEGSHIHFFSRRSGSHHFPEAVFDCRYQPVSSVFHAQKGSLDSWLTERYVLFTAHRHRVHRGDLFHLSWPLQYAEAEIANNTLAEACGFRLPDSPRLLHYASCVKAFIGPLNRV